MAEWIPVSERLPKDYETVIASTDPQKGVIPEARYSKEDGWEWAYESGADYWESIWCDVIAWMPLPEPYNPQQDTAPFDFELYQAELMDMPKEFIEVLEKIRSEIKDIRGQRKDGRDHQDVPYQIVTLSPLGLFLFFVAFWDK